LQQRLQLRGRRTGLISFPRYGETLFAKAIGDYLNGRFGRLNEVNPFLVSLLFAGDRFESKRKIETAIVNDDVLILDRYVASNVAHQAAKLEGATRDELVNWVNRIEYDIFEMPRPDLVILLDLPVNVAQLLISRKDPRGYTDQPADLQEADADYLERVRHVYQTLASRDERWRTVACCKEDRLRSVEEVSEEIWRIVDGG
jgi:dTMP kinase